jgi:hypothetical protein
MWIPVKSASSMPTSFWFCLGSTIHRSRVL